VTIECAKLLTYARFVSSPCTTKYTIYIFGLYFIFEGMSAQLGFIKSY
jgi:hypothetical protein